MGVPPPRTSFSEGSATPKEYRQRRNSNGSVNSGQSANSSVFSCKGYRQGGPINQCTIGRRELLEWLCQSLDLSLSDMTQTYNGAVACQMLDRMHPGVLPMKRVDFNTNQPYYFEQNWRLLQQALKQLGIDYYLDVNQCVHRGHHSAVLQIFRLLKVRYDNWEELGSLPPYNAVWARTQSKTGDMKQANGGTPPSKRYKGRRDFHSGGRLDEPEDRLIPKVIGSESVGDSASSLPTQKRKSGPGFFSRISGHTGGDKTAVSLWSCFVNMLSSPQKIHAAGAE